VIISEHHLIPKSTHKRFSSIYSKDQTHEKINTCTDCHKQIHALLTEVECARDYNTIEKILDHEGMKKFIKWVKKQNPTKKITTKKRKRK
jgi:hypothetical protein